MNIRIIPRLDIKGPNLVKGINFEGLRVLGKPEKFARYALFFKNVRKIYVFLMSHIHRQSLCDLA